jgi:hypothetical protein
MVGAWRWGGAGLLTRRVRSRSLRFVIAGREMFRRRSRQEESYADRDIQRFNGRTESRGS